MSTDVAIREESTTDAVRSYARGAVDLIEWASAARAAHEIAQSLARTEFVPAAMRGRPDSVCAAILSGLERRMSPMMALEAIDIIEGRPALRALTMRGLLLSHGHEVWVEESTDHRAVVCGQRAGSHRTERSLWTIDRARKAGLAHKKNWQAHPAAMLIARATAEVCRLVAADVLLGMPYAAEELSDGGVGAELSSPVAEGKREPSARRVARAASAGRSVERGDSPSPSEPEPVAEPKPPVDACLEEGTAASCPDDAPDDLGPEEKRVVDLLERSAIRAVPLISDAQMKRLHVAFRDAGISGRDERLDYAARVVGHDLESSRDLTMDEASQVIDALVTHKDEIDSHIAFAEPEPS